MVNLHSEILKLLLERNNGLTIKQISRELDSSVSEVEEALKHLIEKFRVVETKKGKFQSVERDNLKVGTLTVAQKGYGFVKIDGMEDVFIPKTKLRGCINNDQVLVRVSDGRDGKLEGLVEKRLSRANNDLVGEVVVEKDGYYITPDDPRYKIKVKVKNINSGIMNGHKVVFKLVGDAKDNTYDGQVTRILGHKLDPGIDVLSVIKSFEVRDIFPDEVIEETKRIPNEIANSDLENRLDLRDEMIFTIDGDDAKDLDDAVSLKILPNGNYELGVHIADVSHYVKPGMEIDKEARLRGTSVYVIDRVVPMIPHKLSNGICSLNEQVDRLTLSFIMEYDKSGKCINFTPTTSVIKSSKRMTYNKVNEILENGVVPEGYEMFASKLLEMQNLAHILRNKRNAKGAVDFDIGEPKILVDKMGKPYDISLRERGEGQRLIEDFMIAANEAVAEYMTTLDLPFIYRIHDIPNENKLEEIVTILAGLGYNANKRIKKDDEIHPKTIQLLLSDLKTRDDYKILANRILRAMKKARYSSNNVGHFGLASSDYAHMTSPIRRYPDLENHRILKGFIVECKFEESYIDWLTEFLVELSNHLSETERTAQSLEREVDKMKAAEYMQDHIGDTYDGLVSDINSKAIYVQLPNLVEGRIALDSVSVNERFIFDEATYTLKSCNSDLIYKIGNKVEVVVTGASKEMHTIDFGIKGKTLVKKRSCHGNTE